MTRDRRKAKDLRLLVPDDDRPPAVAGTASGAPWWLLRAVGLMDCAVALQWHSAGPAQGNPAPGTHPARHGTTPPMASLPRHPPPATLRAPALIDSDAPAVRAFAGAHARGDSERERAVALYLAVRDGFRYDPYRVDLSPEGMAASRVLGNGHGWCVPKAALLTAACRAAGIPARMGFADV